MPAKLKIYEVDALISSRSDVEAQLDPIERGSQRHHEVFVWARTKADAVEYLSSAGVGNPLPRDIKVGMGNHLATIVESGVAGLDGDILVQRRAQHSRHIVRLRRDDNTDPTHVATWRYDRTVGSDTRGQLVLDLV